MQGGDKRKKRERTVFDVAPLLEMSFHDLFRLGPRTRLFDAPDVERAVLPRERADATHVVAIVGKLVAREAVLARIGQRALWIRERVQVLALPAVGAAPAGKEETAVAYAGRVCARQAGIFLDAAPRLGFCLAAESPPYISPTAAKAKKTLGDTYLE
jgi:hypothetical protein